MVLQDKDSSENRPASQNYPPVHGGDMKGVKEAIIHPPLAKIGGQTGGNGDTVTRFVSLNNNNATSNSGSIRLKGNPWKHFPYAIRNKFFSHRVGAEEGPAKLRSDLHVPSDDTASLQDGLSVVPSDRFLPVPIPWGVYECLLPFVGGETYRFGQHCTPASVATTDSLASRSSTMFRGQCFVRNTK